MYIHNFQSNFKWMFISLNHRKRKKPQDILFVAVPTSTSPATVGSWEQNFGLASETSSSDSDGGKADAEKKKATKFALKVIREMLLFHGCESDGESPGLPSSQGKDEAIIYAAHSYGHEDSGTKEHALQARSRQGEVRACLFAGLLACLSLACLFVLLLPRRCELLWGVCNSKKSPTGPTERARKNLSII